MVVYNFKKIQVVPPASDFIDIVLSRTNRKTPTIIHKGYHIARIRHFYMRKVKYTAQTYHDKLTQILQDFPLLDEIHPFYADLINVLYDRDHYKLALGQLNTCRHLVDNLAKDYARLLKYGDSLYRCKCLKRAALGRMCTLMKGQKASLAYLEEVRQHLSRLPSIDPNSRTLLLTGYPNVGKSSFMNLVTRADVDVQPYAFTTKSLFVGHAPYKYLRWQVIDTPGILDHPLEDRNTIEMQAITALAHLRASVLFVVDISEQCGYSIAQQVSLFESIKPLFANKPLLILLNKTDAMKPEDLPDSDKALLSAVAKECGAQLLPMSTLTQEGVMEAKTTACEKLLEQRVETKLQSKQIHSILNRVHVSTPQPRDTRSRPAMIPQTVLEKRQGMDTTGDSDYKDTMKLKKSEKQQGVIEIVPTLEIEDDPEFDPTKYSIDFRKDYLLADDEWKFDAVPQIMDGMNVADYVDPEIEAALEQLEREEDERMREIAATMDEDDEDALTKEEEEMYETIQRKKHEQQLKHREKKKLTRVAPQPRRERILRGKPLEDFESQMVEMGVDGSLAAARMMRGRSRSRKRLSKEADNDAMDVGTEGVLGKKRKRGRSSSKSRDVSVTPGDGYKTPESKRRAIDIEWKTQRKRNKQGRAGDSDRHIAPKLTKHLLTGKRGMGKTDRR